MPCFLRQALEAARISMSDEKMQKRILIEATKIISNVDQFDSSPEVGRELYHLVKKHTGIDDPYREIKKNHIESAQRIYPDMKYFLFKQKDRLEASLKIAAVGNVIDAAVNGNVDVKRNIIEEFDKEFKINDIERFKKDISTAKTLLIIGDNAGETVFDKILVEELLFLDITYAVRSEPIINDATLQEGLESGLNYGTHLISSGCSAPGTILEACSREFLDVYEAADIIISKGQGNYETLSDENRGIFFLLKAKCPVIAKDLGVSINDYVFVCK